MCNFYTGVARKEYTFKPPKNTTIRTIPAIFIDESGVGVEDEVLDEVWDEVGVKFSGCANNTPSGLGTTGLLMTFSFAIIFNFSISSFDNMYSMESSSYGFTTTIETIIKTIQKDTTYMLYISWVFRGLNILKIWNNNPKWIATTAANFTYLCPKMGILFEMENGGFL